MRTLVAVSRSELYQLVWREPATKVAERFGITGTGLRKICDKYDIPVPPRGHWAKLAANKKVPRPRLPRPDEGGEKVRIWRTGGGQAVRDGRASKRAEPVVARREFESRPENKVVVASDQPRRGAWARRLGAILRKGDGYYGTRMDYRGMREAQLEGKVMSVYVSDACQPRALAIVDALESSLRQRRFLKGGGDERRIVVEGVELRLRISEKAVATPRPKPKRRSGDDGWLFGRSNDYVPSGVLALRVSSGPTSSPTVQAWLTETEGKPLEDSLNDAMVLLVEVAVKTRLKEMRLEEEHQQWQLQAEREAEARRLERERLEEERRIHEAEATRTRLLWEDSERWARAEQMRAFIGAVERTGSVPAGVEHEGSLEDWLSWAKRQLEAMDPLT